jgi:hypothetical protein
MSAMVGLAMMFAAILIGRAAKIGIPMQPPPWWASDNMSAFAIAPGIVTLFAGGVAAFGSWLIGGDWRATGLATVAGIAAVIGAYVALSRALKAWARRAQGAPADAVPLAPRDSGDDPKQPPHVPPLKKAA